MNVPFFVAERYLRSGSVGGFASVVTAVSFLGLVLGVVALVVVVSVMNGFDRELKTRILGAVPHLVVSGSNLEMLDDYRKEYPIKAVTRFQEKQALTVSARGSHLISIYGVDPQHEEIASTLAGAMLPGTLDELAQTELGIVLGHSVANKLGVIPGDSLNIIVPRLSRAGGLLKPKPVAVSLTGTFALGSELDYRLGVMRLEDLTGATTESPGLRVTFSDVFAASRMAGELKRKGLEVEVWTERHGDFFETVKMEKVMMFVLLSFVIAVASFSIVAGLSMLVDAKRRDIAVLRTMGLTEGEVMRLFLAQGAMITSLGIVSGIVVGLPLAWYAPDLMSMIETLLGFSIVEGTYFDRIPTDPRAADIAAIVAVTAVIGMAATLYPALRASRLPPAQILRYE